MWILSSTLCMIRRFLDAIFGKIFFMSDFCHLHCHTQFSLLDGAASVDQMLSKAAKDGMPAAAITDHGNMFGVFEFVNTANNKGVKPIIGCEFYMVEDRFKNSFTGGERDRRFHQLLLAKNETGYRNISKLSSLGFIEGLYGKFPRIDKALLREYKEGLIATTCCIGAEVPQAILHKGEEAAEKIFLEWFELFGDDYYIEIQRHGLQNIDNTGMSQEDVNQVLLKWSDKYGVPAIATNDSHYVDELDANAHDILLCINTGDLQETPKGDAKGQRFGFANNEFFFKTQQEMKTLFRDVPQAIENTLAIAEKIHTPQLARDVLLPNFTLPEGFNDQNEYLRHLTYAGARKRYGEISELIRERLDFELETIKKTGYPGYFLIVQDFTSAARNMGVSVGPGRGSAAGSAVAYCLGITNVDPIKYDLLFERFLNPERVSLPDIDIDFDDEGRSRVIDYVVKKYGRDKVAQIVTYGSMAAKLSIRDVGRVLNLPIPSVDYLSKLVPANVGLSELFEGTDAQLKEKVRSDGWDSVQKLREIYHSKNLEAKVLAEAMKLEGSIRNTGVHACGVIITPEELTSLLPVTVAKDSDLLLTQYDNKVVESAGLLKMDFLGLKTLSIINDAIALIEEKHGVRIDPDEIPLDDLKTFELFQKGLTVGVFQFESAGMQKYLKELKPTRFEDLIAMNALYRPGPMEYIPNFIRRKHGLEPITYDDPAMEEYLSETYGITVYQEQVMLLSQKLAGFSKGQADNLRKAMGKKKKQDIDKMKPLFMENAKERGHAPEVMEKVWKDWEAFASYAFNKSHSTCYSVVAFQTAYLKANYPAEYMAAVLTHNMSDIKKVSFFMEECRNLGIEVLGPDVNESKLKFAVNKRGAIRFGMAAIKGVGEAAAEEIVQKRSEIGAFNSLFHLASEVNLRTVNKRSLEALAQAGAFDCFEGTTRAAYIEAGDSGSSGIELAVRYGAQAQQNKQGGQGDLFGGNSEMQLAEPKLPQTEPWSFMEQLNKEKEVIGMFISGHPLDPFAFEVEFLTSHTIASINNQMAQFKGREVRFAGVVSHAQHRTSKDNKRYVHFAMDDYTGSIQLSVWSNQYAQFKGWIEPESPLLVTAKVEEEYGKPGSHRLQIKKITYLSEAKKEYLNGISLSVPYHVIGEEHMRILTELGTQHKGNTPVKIELIDLERNYSVRMNARTLKIEPNSAMVKKLREMKFSVNISLN